MAALRDALAVLSARIAADTEAVADLAVAMGQNSGTVSGANTCHGFSVSDLCSAADSMRSKTRTR